MIPLTTLAVTVAAGSTVTLLCPPSEPVVPAQTLNAEGVTIPLVAAFPSSGMTSEGMWMDGRFVPWHSVVIGPITTDAPPSPGMLVSYDASPAGFWIDDDAFINEPPAKPEPAPAPEPVDADAEPGSVIDIVFALDTTGSMSGMIEGAKQKIWAIANAIATADPRPRLRIGLVAYRDRGDDYVTKRTPLSEDLDAIYADLMTLAAAGGGNHPESVNQALHEAVNEFEWDASPDALKVVYLVGDAPPRMDFDDDVDYGDTCLLAAKSGIIINALQCGSDANTKAIWTEIALASEGSYLVVPQTGGAVVRATPFDAEVNRLGVELTSTLIDYGDPEVMRRQTSKRAAGLALTREAAPAAASDRVLYSVTAVGGRTLLGEQELVADIAAGKIALADVPVEHLPKEMQAMTAEQRAAHIAKCTADRGRITAELEALRDNRGRWLAEAIRSEGGPARSAFDVQLLEVMSVQCAAKGIELKVPEPADVPKTGGETAPAPVAPEAPVAPAAPKTGGAAGEAGGDGGGDAPALAAGPAPLEGPAPVTLPAGGGC